MQNNSLKKYFVVLIIVLVGILVVLIYSNLRTQQAPHTDNSITSKDDILSKLSVIMILPKDEPSPKIATISSIDQLKAQDGDFYKNAVNGDTLILYSSIAVIYRTSENKIVNIAPIASDSTNTDSN